MRMQADTVGARTICVRIRTISLPASLVSSGHNPTGSHRYRRHKPVAEGRLLALTLGKTQMTALRRIALSPDILVILDLSVGRSRGLNLMLHAGDEYIPSLVV